MVRNGEGIELDICEILEASKRLGPHHFKHFKNIERYYDTLAKKIYDNYLLEIFHLNRVSPNPLKEMKKIVSISSPDEVLNLLGCYYSLQLILVNLKALDVLQLNLSTPRSKFDTYRDFLLTTGNDFRKLSGSYMAVLLDDVFLKNIRNINFVICGVGTRVDQDDIDVGVIDEGPEGRDVLNRALSRLNMEMFKNASPLHFHMSEHIGYKSYSASIEEYHKILDKYISNYVVISEMLIAVPILGKLQLFRTFKREITDRYYYAKNGDNRYHEGYIRGLLGEINELSLRGFREDVINPKEDGLRMIKALISIYKVMKNVKKNTLLEVLDILKTTERENIDNFIQLYRAFTFLETFRFLYQLLIVQDEEIYLDNEVTKENLKVVASHMGYEDKSYASTYSQLLIQYQEYIETAKIEIQNLLNKISRHLKKISVFSFYINQHANIPDHVNTVEFFISQSRFFRVATFWEDLFDSLESNKELLDRFIRDISRLSPSATKKAVNSYVRCGINCPYNLISLVVLLVSKDESLGGKHFVKGLIDSFIKRIRFSEGIVKNLSSAFIKYPEKVNKFLSVLDERTLGFFINVLRKPFYQPEVDRYRKKLYEITRLYYASSHYFKRFITRVSTLYPEYIVNFDKPHRLKVFADGLLKNIDNFTTTEEKLEKLGEYYDFEFLRVGIKAINGEQFERINAEFTTFSDNYISLLFEFCKQLVMEKEKKDVITKDLVSVLAAGGHARMQAFDDDYDLIVLLNSDDEELKSFLNKVILKMNRHIIKRSIIAHNRFADKFRNWVTTFTDLKNYFEQPEFDSFIEQTQLLGARIIVGSPRFRQTYYKEIIKPYIFDRKVDLIRKLREEIFSVRESVRESEGYELNIKESPGGLRDFENTFFIIKAYHELTDPISEPLFEKACELEPGIKKRIISLVKNYKFLKHVRDLYHLMVADSDFIYIEALDYIKEPLAKAYSLKGLSRGKIFKRIEHTMHRIREDSTEIVNHFACKLS